jgi:hypothetical protein
MLQSTTDLAAAAASANASAAAALGKGTWVNGITGSGDTAAAGSAVAMEALAGGTATGEFSLAAVQLGGGTMCTILPHRGQA